MTDMTQLELWITLHDLQARAVADRGRRVLRPSGTASLAQILARLARGPAPLRSILQTPKESHP